MSTSFEKARLERLLERYGRYAEPAPDGLALYDTWMEGEEEACPGISRHIREHALRALDSQDPQLLRSAIQALACTGESGDEALLEVLKPRASEVIVAEIEAGIEHLRFRLQSLEALLDEVADRKSFLRFARALAKDRERAQKLEAEDPENYRYDGALGWRHADIATFLHTGLVVLEGGDERGPPSWAEVAWFLYRGKVYQ